MTDPEVLIATPIRYNSKQHFVQSSLEVVGKLTYPRFHYVRHENRILRQNGQGKYAPHAQARNELINTHLKPEHEYVLWLDLDIIATPPDLIENLLSVVDVWREIKPVIPAPMVFVEKFDRHMPASEENGGWFYDVGAFIYKGERADRWPPHWPHTGAFTRMDSVGSCYLVPADLYRQGLRYSACDEEVEHVPFMRQARKLGYQPLACQHIEVTHAYLPRYGEWWH